MRKGFTLVELLVAISLFALAAILANSILIDVVHLEKKTSIQNAIYEDLRIIMQQLTNEIQNGTIDYEEYYSMAVIQGADLNPDTSDIVSPLSASGAPFYGINYGVYGSRFYDPGLELDGTPGDGPEDMGIDCSYPSPLGSNDECEIYYTRSTDVNTGQNPNQNSPTPPEDANAFCHDNTGHCDDPINEVDELYLIDSTGTKKTIIVRKRINTTDYAIGLVRMEGRDLDQNGLVDVFSCSEEYNCSEHADPNVTLFTATGAIKLPNIQDMIDKQGSNYKFSVPRQADKIEAFVGNTAGSQFIPISPLRTSVKDLRFIINPIEDPYKAYAEKDMQSHPSVKIIMTLELSALTADKYPGEFPDITVQTTVAAGVLGKIDSYPPVEDVHVNGADSWIRSALPIDVN